MIIYKGDRVGDRPRVEVLEGPTTRRTLPTYSHIVNHSPDGFEWGYGGSGPSQLAFAICMHATNEDKETVLKVYQKFKFNVVATLSKGGFFISRDFVRKQIYKVLDELD